ncbi:MAG: hypothetical protein KTR31_33585 [Myxococcales bacterium]|nr:hypothetical protein [Myxococcales bacterium]
MTRHLTILSALAIIGCTGDTDTDKTDTDTTEDTGNVTEDIICEGGVCIVSGTILEDTTFTADQQWLLRGGVFVGDDDNETVLTIEPGTTIFGESATDGMLVIRRNSKIMAEGTSDAPIVFTSSQNDGSRAAGDWGGLIINGNAPLNNGDEAFGEGGTGFYGGTDSADDSGVINYVRVEFAGTLLSPDNELNGIAFQGVGSGTEVDYIQVHRNDDDGVEFYGGSVSANHIVVSQVGDDLLDWTDGWNGSSQWVVLQGKDDAGDQGIEADNNGDNNGATPRSNPTLANLTIVGSPDNGDSDIGILLREGTAATIWNALVLGFNDACLDIDDLATWDEGIAGNIDLQNIKLDCVTNFKVDDQDFDDDKVNDADPADLEKWFLAGTGNETGTITMNGDAFDQGAPDFTSSETGGVQPPGLEDPSGIRGGVGADDWTAGWTAYPDN